MKSQLVFKWFFEYQLTPFENSTGLKWFFDLGLVVAHTQRFIWVGSGHQNGLNICPYDMGPIWSNMGPIFHHLGPCIFCTAETEGAIRARGLGIYGLKSGPKWARWAQKSPYKSHMGPRWNRWAPHWPVKSHMSPRYLLVWVCLLDCQN